MYKGDISNKFPPVMAYTSDLFFEDYEFGKFWIWGRKLLVGSKRTIEGLFKDHDCRIYVIVSDPLHKVRFTDWLVNKIITCKVGGLCQLVEEFSDMKIFTTENVHSQITPKNLNISVVRYFDEDEQIKGD